MLVDYLPDPLSERPTYESANDYGFAGDSSSGAQHQGEIGEPLSQSDLPSYSQRNLATPREQTEHVYTLQTSGGRTWLTLKVKSSVTSQQSLPQFVEGETVNGVVELDLEKPMNVKEIVIYIKGMVSCSRLDIKNFVTLSETLFNTASRSSGQSQTSGKLHGRHSFTFSLKLEKDFIVEPKMADKLHIANVETLPPSFGGKGVHSSIDYHLGVDVKQSGIFGSIFTVFTQFGYTPLCRPEQPSALRLQAYFEGTPLLGPLIDPTGWVELPEVDVVGNLFKTRNVSVSCILALATPLAYTRSSVVPCYLTLKSTDTQALDLLSNPMSPVLQIRRKVKSRIGVENMGAQLTHPGTDEALPISKVVWSPPQDSGDETKSMYGELHLPGNLIPSFVFGDFEVKYMVDFYGFKVSGFAADRTDRLSRTEVKVMSAFNSGVKPKAYLPPGYIASRERGAARRANGETLSHLWTGTERA